jgi:hypothetical protein
MILFLIKKTFFDMWDNLFRIFIFNVGFIAVALLTIFTMSLNRNMIIGLVILIAGVAVMTVYCGGVSLFIKEIADYKKPDMVDFISFIKKSFTTSLFFLIFITVITVLIFISLRYYSSIKHMIGYIIFCIMVWVSVFFILSIQHFFPLYGSMNNKPFKTLKKCFLIFIDNPGFSIGLFIGAIIISILSIFTFFLVPGMSGVLLWLNAGMKLRLYKYDYLEIHPEARGKKIPWKELLADDRECVGKRTLKGLIFPWKDYKD